MRHLSEARDLFPGAREATYLNVSVKGLVSTRVRDVIRDYVDARVATGGDKEAMFATVERVRARFARWVNAEPDEVALMKNVSEGVGAIATALEWSRGDNAVLCAALEHPNNVYPWLNLRDRWGVEVRLVEPVGGAVPSQAMADAMDERTRLVTVPTVSFSPGLVTDLAPLAEAARETGAFFLVDAAQSVGVLETDVRAMGVDALATASQKAVCGFYGTGFLYVRRERAETLRPGSLARYGVAFGDEASETAVSTDALSLRPGARRFDLGNYNYLGATAADAALDLLNEFGMDLIEAHARGLARRLAEGLRDLGMPLAGGTGPDLGHIVAVGTPGDGTHDSADDPRIAGLYGHLTRNGVVLSVRRGVLRLSVHLYNDDADVDRVLALTREWMEGDPPTGAA